MEFKYWIQFYEQSLVSFFYFFLRSNIVITYSINLCWHNYIFDLIPPELKGDIDRNWWLVLDLVRVVEGHRAVRPQQVGSVRHVAKSGQLRGCLVQWRRLGGTALVSAQVHPRHSHHHHYRHEARGDRLRHGASHYTRIRCMSISDKSGDALLGNERPN